MEAKVVKERAMQATKEMAQLEQKKNTEKRDMFISRSHEKKKKKKILAFKKEMLQKYRALL